jgi:dTDP-4-dehydrorhamnose reductase
MLLLGANGQVGWELQRALAPLGEVVALGRNGRDHLCGDLARLDALAATVQSVRPDAIVNAAAYTAVDRAESEPELAHAINAAAPAVLAREAREMGAWLVHYSTDYVFDGSGERPWGENDTTGPLNVYGATKLEGEQALRKSGCKHLIFRTSWVYAARGHNFIRTMLRLARERETLTVVDDQIGAPTGAELIADATAHALRTAQRDAQRGGTYHLAARGETSWCGYARFVIAAAARLGARVNMAPDAVAPVASAEYPTPAKRPRNSRLDTAKLERAFGLWLPDWRLGVERAVGEMVTGDR